MNRTLEKKMRTAHERQASGIKKTRDYAKIKRDFDVEYEVAREVAKARADAGMTQRQLAEAMGTTQSVISRIERGANVSIETLQRYVTACGHSLQVRVV